MQLGVSTGVSQMDMGDMDYGVAACFEVVSLCKMYQAREGSYTDFAV
jgi:hypothetical protein